ncbi:hypothetical protein [Streptomyces sp. NPDC050264]|uniref:hypothetical protein n=1 Tax=Streptomyces sp. NPDC050264 TaxID=3155038 RepID=UPI0034195E3D
MGEESRVEAGADLGVERDLEAGVPVPPGARDTPSRVPSSPAGAGRRTCVRSGRAGR